MTADDIAGIERACTALSIAYARALDFRDQEAFLALFTADAVLHVGQEYAGREAIARFLHGRSERLRTRHVVSNVFVDVQSRDEARGISYVTLYRHDGEESRRHGAAPLHGPAAVGHYEDRFVRCRDEWLFRARRLQLAFRDPAQL